MRIENRERIRSNSEKLSEVS